MFAAKIEVPQPWTIKIKKKVLKLLEGLLAQKEAQFK